MGVPDTLLACPPPCGPNNIPLQCSAVLEVEEAEELVQTTEDSLYRSHDSTDDQTALSLPNWPFLTHCGM